MRILIDALGIDQPGGGRTATLNLLAGLFALDHENQYLVLTNSAGAIPQPAGARVTLWRVGLHNRFLVRLWMQLVLPLAARIKRVDVVHLARSQAIFGLPHPWLVTIYDMTVLRHAAMFPLMDVLYWRWLQRGAIRRADKVVAISSYVARDLSERCGLPAGRVQIIYPACDPRFTPQTADSARAVLERYGLKPPLVLHVGSISRKKNLLPLVQAVETLRAQGHDVTLALVGRFYGRARDEELENVLARHETWLKHLGPVPDEDLPALYSAATLLAFPSLDEGFGIVPLEAMACGLPVATSGAGAIREVVGDAARIVEPATDAHAWEATLATLLNDDALRAEMRACGLEQAKEFSVEATARQTLDLYTALARAAK